MTTLPTTQIEDAHRGPKVQNRLDDIDFAFGQRWIAHKGSIGHQIDLVEERFPPVGLNTDHAGIPSIIGSQVGCPIVCSSKNYATHSPTAYAQGLISTRRTLIDGQICHVSLTASR